MWSWSDINLTVAADAHHGAVVQIDVLLVDGVYYGFSGCHRFEAHQRLGLETIRCRVRKANKQVLKMHMM